MKYSVFTAILALGLAGCNLNGLSYDLSGLPSLQIDEVNCNNCNVNVNTADDDQNAEKHFYYGYTRNARVQSGISRFNMISYDDWYFLSKEIREGIKAIDVQHENIKRRVEVDGELGLFIEFKKGKEVYRFEKNKKQEYYIVSGGILTNNGPWNDSNWDQYDLNSKFKYESYSPMPNGVFRYNGKVVLANANSEDFNGFDIGTVKSEIDFNDNSMWIEFEGVGIENRESDFFLNTEEGYFSAIGTSDELPNSIGYYSIEGRLMGQEAKGMEGTINSDSADSSGIFNDRVGVFVAERSDTPVVAEN